MLLKVMGIDRPFSPEELLESSMAESSKNIHWERVLGIVARVNEGGVFIDEFDQRYFGELGFVEEKGWIKYSEREEDFGKMGLTKEGHKLCGYLVKYIKELK